MNIKLFSIGIALLLIVAIAELPYGFYTFLRIVVCSYSAYLAVAAFSEDKRIWVFAFIAIAIVFNPLVPIYLEKEIWIIIDILCAIYYVIVAIKSPIIKQK